MIKCNKGMVELGGDIVEITSEMVCVVKSVLDLTSEEVGQNPAELIIRESLELAFKDAKDIPDPSEMSEAERMDFVKNLLRFGGFDD